MSFDTSLAHISDALQIPIHFANGTASGVRGLVWNCAGFPVPMSISVSKLFTGEQVGVLAHIHGDLHVVVSHYPKTGALSAYLIDGDKVRCDGVAVTPDSLISKKMGLREVVESLRGAIVGAYYWKNHKWQSLKLPN